MYDDVVMAPTGWRKSLRLLRMSLVCAALSYSSATRTAFADAPLRITGSLEIEASASLGHGASELSARLLDDAGHAVVGVEVRVTPAAPTHPSSVRECRAHAPELSADSEGAYTAHSDGSGSFCLHFDGIAERAEFELAFSDANGFYAPAVRHVVADGAVRSVEMAFSPAPSVLELERAEQVLAIATRPSPPLSTDESVEHLALILSGKREVGAPRELAKTNVEIGSSAELHVPSKELGGPGPLELDVAFAGSGTTRAAHVNAHVTCTALAELSLLEPLAATRPESGVRVRVRVGSIAGPVPSGSVEARIGNDLLGSARVLEGNAELNVKVDESVARAAPLVLNYVADSPWWLASRSLEVEIPISPPSPWPRIAWIAGAIALCAWLFSSWQRPRRREENVGVAPRPTVRAPVDVLEVGDAARGWYGRVLDAHDGTPIDGATVLIRLPSFDGQGVLRSAETDTDGAFAIDGANAIGPGAALEVRAPWHTPLAAPMPPPGQLVLSLVSRRRSLIARFASWTRSDVEWAQRHEPTPGEVARRAQRTDVSTWARALDEAAFGPEPLSETKEQGVVGREPSHGGKLP